MTLLLPEGWTLHPAPTEARPERVLLMRDQRVRVSVPNAQLAAAFLQGWQARQNLQKRGYCPVHGRGARSSWFRGWDWCNTFIAQAEQAQQSA